MAGNSGAVELNAHPWEFHGDQGCERSGVAREIRNMEQKRTFAIWLSQQDLRIERASPRVEVFEK